MITVHTHVINPLFFRKTKAKLEGALVVRGKFYENFFGMSKKKNAVKEKLGSLPFAVNIHVHCLETAFLLPVTLRQNH